MSLLCKLGLHRWEMSGRPRIFTAAVRLTYKCLRCGRKKAYFEHRVEVESR